MNNTNDKELVLQAMREYGQRQYNQLNDHEHRITQLEAKCKERDDT